MASLMMRPKTGLVARVLVALFMEISLGLPTALGTPGSGPLEAQKFSGRPPRSRRELRRGARVVPELGADATDEAYRKFFTENLERDSLEFVEKGVDHPRSHTFRYLRRAGLEPAPLEHEARQGGQRIDSSTACSLACTAVARFVEHTVSDRGLIPGDGQNERVEQLRRAHLRVGGAHHAVGLHVVPKRIAQGGLVRNFAREWGAQHTSRPTRASLDASG
jgi:hypothetical protein